MIWKRPSLWGSEGHVLGMLLETFLKEKRMLNLEEALALSLGAQDVHGHLAQF